MHGLFKSLCRFVTAAALAAAMLALQGCGNTENESKSVLNYEQPTVTMIRAVKLLDTQSYLNCFTPGAREKYENSDNYNSKLTQVLLPSQGKSSASLKIETLSAQELEADDIAKLEDDYRESYSRRLSISKAYDLSVQISTLQNEKETSDVRDIIVVNTGEEWLIYGDVIEKFNFREQQE
ncbi:hypothetical protein [Ruminococcus sp. Marseille-P6503]|uniref:hypothetical protein n=1 Tax=Ruminococcus sp. Marseille-P6503 TaxID=2364796 RepID=UPI000F522AD3|nr:hypothetical protein [Ruminococcus sp. Marseille-P6503]